MANRKHPLQAMLQDVRSRFVLWHPNEKDFKVPMTLDQIDEMILVFGDNDYYKRAIDAISDQVSDVQVELDRIKEIATHHYKKADKFGQASDAKQILDAIEKIEGYFGKGDFDDSEGVQD